MPPRLTYLPAILWALASTAIWTLIFAAVKASGGAVGAFQLTFLRGIGSLAVLVPMALATGGFGQYRSRQPWAHLARTLCGSGAAVAITWASAEMPIVDATAIAMLYGPLAVVLGVVVLAERVGPLHGLAVVVSLAGALVVALAQGAFSGGLVLAPVLASLGGALLMAVEGVLIRVLGQRDRALTVMLYVTVLGLMVLAVPAVLDWQPLGPLGLLACLALGPFAVLGQYCTIRGYRAAPLSVVAPVDNAWLIFAAVLGFLAFGEVPGPMTVLGAALIIAGGVALTRVKAR